MGALRFSDYLVRRLPLTAGFRNMHILVRPTENGLPAVESRDTGAGAEVESGAGTSVVDHLPDEMDRESVERRLEEQALGYEAEEEKYPSHMERFAYDEAQQPDPYDDDDYDTLAFGVEDKMGIRRPRRPSDDPTAMISILEGMSKLGGPASNISQDNLNRLNFVDEEPEEEVKYETGHSEGGCQEEAPNLCEHTGGNDETGGDEVADNNEEDASALRALHDLGYGEDLVIAERGGAMEESITKHVPSNSALVPSTYRVEESEEPTNEIGEQVKQHVLPDDIITEDVPHNNEGKTGIELKNQGEEVRMHAGSSRNGDEGGDAGDDITSAKSGEPGMQEGIVSTSAAPWKKMRKKKMKEGQS